MSKDSLSSSLSSSRIIPKEESSDFKTWAVPEVVSKEDEDLAELSNFPMLTAEQLEEIHQQAYQEGYQEGQQKGYDEGFKQGNEAGKTAGHKQAFDASLEEIQQQAFHFDQIFKSLEEPFSQVSEQVEHEIVTLAIAIAKQIVLKEIESQPDAIIPLLKKTLHLLPSYAKEIKIFLHPSDLKLIKNAYELTEELDLDKYHLYDDINLTRGGCIVDTDISHIDASIDKRIAEIAASLIPSAPEIAGKNTAENQQTESAITEDNELDQLSEDTAETITSTETESETVNNSLSNDESELNKSIAEPPQ